MSSSSTNSNFKQKPTKNVNGHGSKSVEILVRGSHFNKMEVENLIHLHKTLSTKIKMDKLKFREFLYNHFNLTDDLIMDRIFKVFDTNSDGYITSEEWLYGLSTFIRGSLDERVEFCFNLYDLNNDGWITKEEVYGLLKKSVVRHISEEESDDAVKELVELVIKKLDKDNDHKISQKDFRLSVDEEQLLMECLGSCLPDIRCIRSFEDKFLRGPICLRELM